MDAKIVLRNNILDLSTHTIHIKLLIYGTDEYYPIKALMWIEFRDHILTLFTFLRSFH